MVKLRLKRAGKKRAAFYRIVASDSRVKRDGEYIELVGTYNPINGEVNLQNELALKWLKDGAQPTDTVRNILSKNGILKQLHEFKLSTKSSKESKPKKAKAAAPKKTVAKKTTKSTESSAEKEVKPKKTVAKKTTTTKEDK
ncbi:30S ribosomal protein S16 [Spiroplasma turonicum]|uniref:Small ribosomal subunit protein bS16 n=1 Tax=Spiroplasma turonicum TaxID=216946 RepID=A0A0K1P6X5_9MOLU|nr:30S ribosomal protein S16 [Spiroplasma turonicum]ALX71063.1 30S ribosomal protein S16 [Spiroplasma turonicum]